MAKTNRINNTTEYFAAVKTLPEVREIAVLNLGKIDDPEFVKAFTKAYNANRENQVGRYGRYKAKATVTANGYLKICHAIKAITEIKIGRTKINLNIAFRYGGINLSGDTKPIKDLLKAMDFRWNHKTAEWYNNFAVMPKIPEIPKTVKAEKATVKATQPAVKKTGRPKLAEPKKITDPKEKAKIFAENRAKVATRKASRARAMATTQRA